MITGKSFRLPLLLALLLSGGACRQTPVPEAGHIRRKAADTALQRVLADTIIYDVVIRNPNPDDPWAIHCLGGLDRRLLIDQLFEWIYAGKITAYDHETREKLTPRQVKQIETAEGFSRDDIGMIQFTEAWYVHGNEAAMTKAVMSMVLGYDYYTPDGNLLYKALFRVEMGK